MDIHFPPPRPATALAPASCSLMPISRTLNMREEQTYSLWLYGLSSSSLALACV